MGCWDGAVQHHRLYRFSHYFPVGSFTYQYIVFPTPFRHMASCAPSGMSACWKHWWVPSPRSLFGIFLTVMGHCTVASNPAEQSGWGVLYGWEPMLAPCNINFMLIKLNFILMLTHLFTRPHHLFVNEHIFFINVAFMLTMQPLCSPCGLYAHPHAAVRA